MENNPLIMYFIVRSSLNMGSGKIAAQCAHAAQIMTTIFWTLEEKDPAKKTFQDWLAQDYRKVVLKAKDSEFNRIKNEFNCSVVIDNGLTEVKPGSETVIVLYPMKKSEQPPFLKRLRVL